MTWVVAMATVEPAGPGRCGADYHVIPSTPKGCHFCHFLLFQRIDNDQRIITIQNLSILYSSVASTRVKFPATYATFMNWLTILGIAKTASGSCPSRIT